MNTESSMVKRRDHLACYQLTVQKPSSIMVSGCISVHSMGHLHICKGPIYFDQYIKALKHHMLPKRGLPYFSKTMPNYILHVLQLHGSILKKTPGAKLAWIPYSPLKHLAKCEEKYTTKEAHK